MRRHHPAAERAGGRFCRFRMPALALAAALLVSLWGTAHAAQTTVRVGFFAFSGYHEMDEEGRLSGYGYEFHEIFRLPHIDKSAGDDIRPG